MKMDKERLSSVQRVSREKEDSFWSRFFSDRKAFLLLLGAGEFSVWNCDTYSLARELLTLPQAILLVCILAGAIIEERNL